MLILDKENIENLTNYLWQKKWLKKDEINIEVTKPGEGNMNYVLRIDTGKRSFIIKQARPYVEKYPQIAAPVERAQVEAAFYASIQHNDMLKSNTPLLLATDPDNNVLVLQDLGKSSDFNYLYQQQKKLTEPEAIALTRFLNELHNNFRATIDPLLHNTTMKALNHEHIFVYPFLEENGLNLDNITPGLQQLSIKYKTDENLKAKLEVLGNIYLGKGPCLLHGDYYPGSWLHTATGIKIIDPEFCFYGPPQFDLGVMLAHCHLSSQPKAIIDTIHNHYNKHNQFDESLLEQFEGVEIMRRIIGLAQLPLTLDLNKKKALLEKSYALIMQ